MTRKSTKPLPDKVNTSERACDVRSTSRYTLADFGKADPAVGMGGPASDCRHAIDVVQCEAALPVGDMPASVRALWWRKWLVPVLDNSGRFSGPRIIGGYRADVLGDNDLCAGTLRNPEERPGPVSSKSVDPTWTA